ncbi:SUKH-4 family immunity protein [Streptomyces sp. NPDC005012]|uniref:SUKH-4 family immunity protein n=1 Tax=Streptomyces sp. NPDC005012 TaxID=3154558 RepID=UPI0033B659E9
MVAWSAFERADVESVGARAEDVELLCGVGLPEDSCRMFVRNRRRDMEVRDVTSAGRLAFLGDFEDGVNTYWLNVSSGSVWMASGYEFESASFTCVNSSLRSLQEILEIWEGFIFSGIHEEDDAYEALVERTLAAAYGVDPGIFRDEESWWSRVFEEIELGSLGPV